MYMCVRNIDVVSVPCEWSCIYVLGISMFSLFLVAWSCIETISIFLTHIYMTTHKEQRQHRYSWHTYIHDHSQWTETTSIFLTDIYMTTYKEQRQHRYSWVMDMCVRNIDVVSVLCEWSCICLSGISMYSLFLVAWSCICVSGISMLSLFLVSARNRDNIDIPYTYIHDHSQGIETTSIFLTHIYTWPLTMNRDNIYISDTYIHCSLWVVMYMSVMNIDVVSVPCEWSCIYVSGISM
jgi:hypothetical protein